MSCSDIELKFEDIECGSVDFVNTFITRKHRIPRKLKKKIKGNVCSWFSKKMRVVCFDAPMFADSKYIFKSYPVRKKDMLYLPGTP